MKKAVVIFFYFCLIKKKIITMLTPNSSSMYWQKLRMSCKMRVQGTWRLHCGSVLMTVWAGDVMTETGLLRGAGRGGGGGGGGAGGSGTGEGVSTSIFCTFSISSCFCFVCFCCCCCANWKHIFTKSRNAYIFIYVIFLTLNNQDWLFGPHMYILYIYKMKN